jgi:ADP-dependent NAD(P)H-hydrate dehydratase / NAD(P)H-hydrate epimerase
MRSGAGLVTLGIPKGLNNSLGKIKPKEVMTLPLPETRHGCLSLTCYDKIKDFSEKVDLLVVGPGLGQDKSTQSLVRKIISRITKQAVIDADGLNALVGHLQILRAAGNPILTPHPGEMARLLGLSVSEVQSGRVELAKKFARDFQVTVVLKGHRTVVAGPQGDMYLNRTGNPGMATGGSGDVLTGIIAAFLGQGLKAFEAAKFGVYLHGLAGDLAAKEKTQISLIASDIIDKIPEAVKICS